MEKVKKYLSLFKKAQTEREEFNYMYDNALKYVASHRMLFNSNESRTLDRNERAIYHPIGKYSRDKFVAKMQNDIVPPKKKWLKFVKGANEEGIANSVVQKKFENLRELLFAGKHNSKHDLVMTEFFYDLALGTAVMSIQKGKSRKKPFIYTAIPLHQVYFLESVEGEIDTVFRDFVLTEEMILEKWEGAKITDKMNESNKENKDEKIFKILELVAPNKTIKKVPVEKDGITEIKEKKINAFKYIIICQDTKEIIFEKEMGISPWVIVRYSKESNEIYGVGPMVQTEADLAMLNADKKSYRKALELAVEPPLLVSTVNFRTSDDINISPRELIPLNDINGIKPLNIQLPHYAREKEEQEIIKRIEKAYLVSPFNSDSKEAVKTAYENSLREQSDVMHTGAVEARLQSELIVPMTNIELSILQEFGIIKRDDEGDISIDGFTMSLEYNSEIHRTQEKVDLSNFVNAAQTVIGLFGKDLGLGSLEHKEILSFIADKNNIPRGLFADDEKIDSLINAMGQQENELHSAQVGQQNLNNQNMQKNIQE